MPSLTARLRLGDTRRALWPHQRDAVDASVKTLIDVPRATVVAACGSGKTTIGAEVAAEMVPDGGRLLFAAPNLELISQTLREYRLGARELGRVVAVCSDQGAVYHARVDLAAEQAEVTTDPRRLAALLAQPGPATVACTYQSLGVVRDAHAHHGLAPWDLAIADEAHRTAGVRGKSWGIIHDDGAVPAARRLYLTATPRVYDRDDDQVTSMDDEAIFGPVAYRLPFADAIERGLLADFRVVVTVITDAEILRLVEAQSGAPFLQSGSQAVDPRMLAAQVAVLRAAHQFGAQRMITYHARVADAQFFAHTLPSAADLLDPDQRPTRLTSLHVHGRQDIDKRRPILARLGAADAGTVVVSNARVLGEGVDAPAVDGVAFLSPRDSAESTVQAVGRALRLGNRPGKTAIIMIPLVLGPDETPESALDGSVYSALWRAIRALRAHDERLATQLDAARFDLGRHAGQPPQEKTALPTWLRFTGAPVPEGFAAAITLRMLRETTPSWEEWYGRATAFFRQHGHLMPPPSDREFTTWIVNQRQRYRRGRMSKERAERLNAIGMRWSAAPDGFARQMACATAFHRRHGHLRVPSGTRWGDPPADANGFFSKLRESKRSGRLTPAQVAQAEAIGFEWNPQAEARRRRFERGYGPACAFHREHGHLHVTRGETWQGVDLHQWLKRLMQDHGDDLLEALVRAHSGTSESQAHAPGDARVTGEMVTRLRTLGVQFPLAGPADEALAMFLCRMAAIRRAAGVAKVQLSGRLDLATDKGAVVDHWERGLSIPYLDKVWRWAEELEHDLLIVDEHGELLARWVPSEKREFWHTLRARRQQLGIVRAALAGELGLADTTVRAMESGHRVQPSLRFLLGYLISVHCHLVPSPRSRIAGHGGAA